MAPVRETQDGAGTAPEDCARRIVRMLGRDLTAAPMRAWQALAAYLAQAQLVSVREALERVLSRDPEGLVPFVGAGVDLGPSRYRLTGLLGLSSCVRNETEVNP